MAKSNLVLRGGARSELLRLTGAVGVLSPTPLLSSSTILLARIAVFAGEEDSATR